MTLSGKQLYYLHFWLSFISVHGEGEGRGKRSGGVRLLKVKHDPLGANSFVCELTPFICPLEQIGIHKSCFPL